MPRGKTKAFEKRKVAQEFPYSEHGTVEAMQQSLCEEHFSSCKLKGNTPVGAPSGRTSAGRALSEVRKREQR